MLILSDYNLRRYKIPNPKKGQSQNEYISALGKKECYIPQFEVKETKDGNLIVKGYIATTHLDSGFMDEKRDTYIRDRISKETLESWAEEINRGNPRVNKASVNHKREPHVAGVGMKGSARVERLPDGEHGLYVETLIDKTREDFPDIKSRIDNKLLDSFSIEFATKDPLLGDYLPESVREQKYGEGIIRTLLPGAQLEGWTLASQPMNEYAIMVKEIFNKKVKEENNMKKEEEAYKEEEEEEDTEEESPQETDVDKVKKKVAKKGATPAQMNQSDGVAPATHNEFAHYPKAGKEVSMEALQIGNAVLEMKEKQQKEKELRDFKESMRKEILSEIRKMPIQNKVAVDNAGIIEKKEIVEFKEILKEPSKFGLKEQCVIAAAYANAKGHRFTKQVEHRIANGDFKVSYNGKGGRTNLIEFKGLGLTTNQNSDTDYLLSAAELSDSFDPVIYNALNQQTVTWNILNKDDYSNKGNNMVQFTLKTAANTTATSYTGTPVNTGNVTRLKMETRFKKYQAGVAVDGDMIAAARGGPIGDVFAQEVMDSTIDLLSVMNKGLFGENPEGQTGLETSQGVITFKYLADSATYTSLYNLTRSTTNRLAPDAAADTYITASSARISPALLRQAKQQALKDGSMIQNLVYVTNHTQADLFRAIYDAAQRPVPTSSKFGFEGRPEFDGIAIFEDKDCATSDWYLVDLDSTRVAIWVPPTLEMLGKDSDSQKGFIKCYWCTYCRAPRRLVNIYSCATS